MILAGRCPFITRLACAAYEISDTWMHIEAAAQAQSITTTDLYQVLRTMGLLMLSTALDKPWRYS